MNNKPLSIFGLFIVTTFSDSSRLFALPSLPSSDRLMLAVVVLSHDFTLRVTLSHGLPTTELPLSQAMVGNRQQHMPG